MFYSLNRVNNFHRNTMGDVRKKLMLGFFVITCYYMYKRILVIVVICIKMIIYANLIGTFKWIGDDVRVS